MALPPSSPRLPSPPPAAEIQIGPSSSGGGGGGGNNSSGSGSGSINSGSSGSGNGDSMDSAALSKQLEQQAKIEQTALEANARRRIHPGTRAADFAVGPPLVPLHELDSAFQLQEHLAALHYFHTASNTQPLGRETARTLAAAPVGIDRTLWLYELCRFLISHCNSLIVGFLFDTPPCSAATCPEMRASEWQFLCAVHEQPKSCCAIDYCCHTLDWAANVVTNPKIFPSRFVFADPHDKGAAARNLVNIFRRLHRIFAHAWFQHRGVFWSVEGQTGLYVFFKTVCDMYDLLPAENYKLPPEAEGLETTTATSDAAASAASGTTANAAGATSNNTTTESVPGLISIASIADRKAFSYSPSPGLGPGAGSGNGSGLRRPNSALLSSGSSSSNGITTNGAGDSNGVADFLAAATAGDNIQHVGRTNTRRHIRSSPSTGSAVTTVMEQDEETATAAAAAATNGGSDFVTPAAAAAAAAAADSMVVNVTMAPVPAAAAPVAEVESDEDEDEEEDEDEDEDKKASADAEVETDEDDAEEDDKGETVPVIVQSDELAQSLKAGAKKEMAAEQDTEESDAAGSASRATESEEADVASSSSPPLLADSIEVEALPSKIPTEVAISVSDVPAATAEKDDDDSEEDNDDDDDDDDDDSHGNGKDVDDDGKPTTTKPNGDGKSG